MYLEGNSHAVHKCILRGLREGYLQWGGECVLVGSAALGISGTSMPEVDFQLVVYREI